eukprot:TRINITY_DN1308_c0_g1_i1.p2 TRINITY_DN1308_c0_g1~~TRINITY_DN1308_c0_g1_i1.p2  ORF type:complete len:438 (+),score=32.09 TRINITY_DN1308_c0_g1_i1:2554-3867(+)
MQNSLLIAIIIIISFIQKLSIAMETPYLLKLTPASKPSPFTTSSKLRRFQASPKRLTTGITRNSSQGCFSTFSRAKTISATSQKVTEFPCAKPALISKMSEQLLGRTHFRTFSAVNVPKVSNKTITAPRLPFSKSTVSIRRKSCQERARPITKARTTKVLGKIKQLASGTSEKIALEIKALEEYIDSLQPRTTKIMAQELMRWKTTHPATKIEVTNIIRKPSSIHRSETPLNKPQNIEIYENRKREEEKLKEIYENLDFSKDERQKHVKRAVRRLSNSLYFISKLRRSLPSAKPKPCEFVLPSLPKEPLQSENATEFLIAVKCANLAKVKEMLEKNRYLVYEFDYVGRTALHHACRRNLYNIMVVLVQYWADVNACDAAGRAPLYLAAKYASAGAVKLLLRNNASLYYCTHTGKTPMEVARNTAIKTVLDNGLKVFC